MLTDSSDHSSEDEDRGEASPTAFSYPNMARIINQIGGGKRKSQDTGDAEGETKEDKKEFLLEKMDTFLTRNGTDDVIISPSKELVDIVDFTKKAVADLPDSEFTNFVKSLAPVSFHTLVHVETPWRDLLSIIEESKNNVETNPNGIFDEFLHELEEIDVRTLVKVAGSKTKDTNVRCEAVRNIIFRDYIKPIQKLQRQLKEGIDMLATTVNLILVTQVSDDTGRIQWNSAYQDFLLDCIHKGCRKTASSKTTPVHHHIASDDDPMEGLTHKFRNLSGIENTHGSGQMPEPKKRGRPPKTATWAETSNCEVLGWQKQERNEARDDATISINITLPIKIPHNL